MDSYSAGYKLGKALGFVVFTLLPLYGGLRCFWTMWRPGTSKLCLLSLGVGLTSLAVVTFAGSVVSAVENPLVIALLHAATFAGLFGLVASFVLAIVGLATYRRGEGGLVRGKSQAVWALVLSSVTLLALAGFLIYSLWAAAGPRSLAAGTGPGSAGKPVGQGEPSEPGEVVAFEDLNFRLRVPAGWRSIDPEAVNPEACLVMVKPGADVFLAVIAEDAGVEIEDSTALADISKANLTAAGPQPTFGDERTVEVDGLHFTFFDARLSMGTLGEFEYEYAVCAKGGYFYQLVMWKLASAEIDLLREMAVLAEGFSLIDPEKRSPAVAASTVGDYESDAYGFRMNLEGLGWSAWPTLHSEMPEAVFGASRHFDAGTSVVAIRGGYRADSLEAEAEAFAEAFHFDYPGGVRDIGEVEQGGVPGLQFECDRVVDGAAMTYRFRVFRSGAASYFVGAWCESERADFAEVMAVLDRFEVIPEGATADAVVSKDEREAEGLMLNQIGLRLFGLGRFVEASTAIARSVELVPDNPVFVGNLAETRAALGDHRGAAEVLEAGLVHVPGQLQLLGQLAGQLAMAGELADAAEAYRKLFDEGVQDEDHLFGYLNVLVELERVPEAIAVTENMAGKVADEKLSRWRGTLLSRAGRHDEAVELLTAMQDANPGDTGARSALAEAFLEAGRFSEAFEVSAGESADWLVLRARAEIGLGQLHDAKRTLQAAKTKSPSDPVVGLLLDQVAGSLGQSYHPSLRSDLEPVSLDGDVLSELGLGALPGPIGGVGTRVTAIDFVAGERFRKTEYQWLKVEDNADRDQLSTFRFGFDPLTEDICVNRLRVVPADGGEAAEVNQADLYVTDDLGTGMATEDKVLHVPVRGLEVGATVEVIVTTAHKAGPDSFPYEFFAMANLQETALIAVCLTRGVAGVASVVNGDVARRELGDTVVWERRDSDGFRIEPLQDNIDSLVPTLRIGAAGAGWAGLGGDYLGSITEKLAAGETVRREALAAVEGAPSDEEKVGRLAVWVQRRCQYQALEFGSRGRVPNTPEETLANRYGDCKDHAVLLRAMLGAAGIESHLALVNTAGDVAEEIASLDQFDHMVLYVPGVAAGLLVDGTVKGVDPLLGVAYNLAGKRFLVLEEGAVRFESAGAYPSGSELFQVRRTVALGDDSRVDVEDVVTMSGYQAGALRGAFEATSEIDRESVINRLWSQERLLHIDRVEWSGLDNPKESLGITVAYHLEPEGGNLRLPTPLVSYFLKPEPVKTRTTPFRLHLPLRLQLEVNAEARDGRRVRATPGTGGKADGEFVTWDSKVESTGGSVTQRASVDRAAGKFPAEDYQEWVQAMKQAMDGVALEIELEPGSGP